VYELRERLSRCPFEGEVVETVLLAIVVGANDSRMLHPRAVPSLSEEALDGGRVFAHAFSEDLHGAEAPFRVLCAVHACGPAFANSLEQAVARNGPAREVFVWHEGGRK
jgi:hypothetical protein